MSIDTDRADIGKLVNDCVSHYSIKDLGLQAWEELYGQLRAGEPAFVAELCAIQRYINGWKKVELRAQERLYWFFHVAEYQVENEEEVENLSELERIAHENIESAFITLQLKARELLTWTGLRERCQKWILAAYLRKVMPGRNMELSEAQEARYRSFHWDVEYSVGRVEDGMVGWFQLHNLALDQVSAIRAAMDQSVSLFPDEE